MVTEPQDVLAEALHHFGHEYDIDGRQEWHSLNCIYRKTWPMGGDDEPGCIAVRAALVRTPETLDVERPQPRREREHREKDASGKHWWRCIPISEAYLLAATPSPTPPEGLRAALEQALEEHRNQDGLSYSSTCWCIAAEAALAASPAPDPGAGLREALEAKHERACSCPFDGTDPDCNLTVSGSWLGSWLAPSAEPPETETPSQRAWREALARPSFRAALDEGLADLEAGRTTRLAEPPETET